MLKETKDQPRSAANWPRFSTKYKYWLKPRSQIAAFETPYKYFLNVPAVTATLSANSVANGSITKLGCKLNGSARYTTHVKTSKGSAERFAQW